MPPCRGIALPAPTVKAPLGINGVPLSASQPSIPPPPSDDDGLMGGGTRPGAVAAPAAPAAVAASQKSAARAASVPPLPLAAPSFYDTSNYAPGDPHRAAIEMQKRMQAQRLLDEAAQQVALRAQQQWAAEAAQTAQQAAAGTAPDGNEEEEYEEHPIAVEARAGGMTGKSWQHWDDRELIALLNAGAFMCV